MIRSFLDALVIKFTGGREKADAVAIDYLSILNVVKPLVEDHTIYLETSDGRFIENGSSLSNDNVVSVCIAYTKEGVKPWETEVPAKYMLKKVGGVIASTPLLLLSRNPAYFIGYYVQIKGA